MTRLLALFLVLLANPAGAGDATDTDAYLTQVIRAFDLRPLPVKPFDENQKYRLGRALFFDPILSGNRDVSCATCHLLSRGTTDAQPNSHGTGASGLAENRTLSEGRTRQPRNALDLWNRDNNRVRTMFWDGRIETLDPVARAFRSPLGDSLPEGLENLMAVQALLPLVHADEMLGVPGDRAPAELPAPHAGTVNELAADSEHLDGTARISAIHKLIMLRLLGGSDDEDKPWHAAYRALFHAAYPDEQGGVFTIVHVANALSHFEEIAFATRNVPWDLYVAGETGAIGTDAKRGALLFFGKGRCVACHEGPLFSDFSFHGIGVPNHGPGFDGQGGDTGRYRVTGQTADLFLFRTPPLRNVTLTAPYFHNGSAETLREAINQHIDPFRHADQYKDSGAFVMGAEQVEAISPILIPGLRLSAVDVDALIAFLKTLEDSGLANRDRIIPAKVPSGLPVSALD